MRSRDDAVYWLKYHLAWCPKYRRPVLAGMVANRLKEFLATRVREIHALEVMPNHIDHFSDPERSPSHLAHQFASRLLRPEFPSLRSRLPTLWSRSYFVGSVGTDSEATVPHSIEFQRGR